MLFQYIKLCQEYLLNRAKGQQMPGSLFRKLVPFAESSKQKGVKVYHLSIGQPDIKTPKVGIDAIKNSDIEILAYSRSEGSQAHREKLAEYYIKNKIDVTANDIIVAKGGSEALLFTFDSIMDHSR